MTLFMSFLKAAATTHPHSAEPFSPHPSSTKETGPFCFPQEPLNTSPISSSLKHKKITSGTGDSSMSFVLKFLPPF